jgi:hypothetical protein
MVIDLVLKPRISPGVAPRLAFKDSRSAVRQEQACPDKEGARLAVGDLTVVDSLAGSDRWLKPIRLPRVTAALGSCNDCDALVVGIGRF